jgi:hypothetical protein
VRTKAGRDAARRIVTRTARCSCGQLTVACEGEPERVAACHCSECRRRTGSAFGIAVFFPIPAVTVSGRSSRYERIGDSGKPLEHHFCPDCGTTLFWYPAARPGRIAVAGGCFADATIPAPEKSAYAAQQQGWLSLQLDSPLTRGRS